VAGLLDTDMIDLVVEQPDGGALLVIVKERDWAPGEIAPRKAKLNTYAWFVIDGLLANQYPVLANRQVCIRVECATPPPADVRHVLDLARERFAPHGIDVDHNVNPRL